MKYKVREKIFSFGDNFYIKDEYDNDAFFVRGKIFTFGNKLRLEDLTGKELIYIEQKLLKLLPEYNIYKNGQHAARIKKEFSFFRPEFCIKSNMGNYKINGDFFGRNFRILKNDIPIAVVTKEFFSFSDTYEIDISDNEDQAFILSLVVVIDQVLYDSKNND